MSDTATPVPDEAAAPPLSAEDRLREQAETLLERLAGGDAQAALAEARDLVLGLRNVRAYELMGRLAEAVSRVDPDDARNRRLYAQCLIETGRATAAIDMLRQLLLALPAGHAEAVEAAGLIGRASKQIFFDAGDKSSAGARAALAQAIDAYRRPYEADPAHAVWHGVNLLALVSRARREGWAELVPDLDPAALAGALVAALLAMPVARRDEWYLPTLAEAMLGQSLASGDLTMVEQQLRGYIGAPGVQAFQVASTLRQFSEVWGLDGLRDDTPGTGLRDAAAVRRARGLVDVLRARLMQLPGGGLVLPAARVQGGPAAGAAPAAPIAEGAAAGADELQALAARGMPAPAAPPAGDSAPHAAPEQGQLEAILGVDGPQTFAWWRAGIEAARSVAVIRQRLGKRLGTGFLVRAGDFGLAPADEPLLLTNFHVVNPQGATPGIRPEMAEVVFEADSTQRVYRVTELLWSSPIEQHDASLLRLDKAPAKIAALKLGVDLPALPAAPGEGTPPRVYIIGYPGGRELSFSFQDNELLDHEGPPSGKPQISGVCRVHYRAPTEGGNSGSPVFNAGAWQVIALHHKGGRFGMPRLNGLAGSYAANEGLAMTTLVTAVKASPAAAAAAPAR